MLPKYKFPIEYELNPTEIEKGTNLGNVETEKRRKRNAC